MFRSATFSVAPKRACESAYSASTWPFWISANWAGVANMWWLLVVIGLGCVGGLADRLRVGAAHKTNCWPMRNACQALIGAVQQDLPIVLTQDKFFKNRSLRQFRTAILRAT